MFSTPPKHFPPLLTRPPLFIQAPPHCSQPRPHCLCPPSSTVMDSTCIQSLCSVPDLQHPSSCLCQASHSTLLLPASSPFHYDVYYIGLLSKYDYKRPSPAAFVISSVKSKQTSGPTGQMSKASSTLRPNISLFRASKINTGRAWQGRAWHSTDV